MHPLLSANLPSRLLHLQHMDYSERCDTASVQVLKLVNAVPYEPPSAEEEEAFLAEPCHIMARLYRDLFKDEETAKATLAVCAHCIPFCFG